MLPISPRSRIFAISHPCRFVHLSCQDLEPDLIELVACEQLRLVGNWIVMSADDLWLEAQQLEKGSQWDREASLGAIASLSEDLAEQE